MSAYNTTDKTDWFIRKMSSGWFSRQEIVVLAAGEFQDISRKKLEGTIGQYWSDCVNPKWPTYKAIQVRGLKAVQNDGQRRIVADSGAFTSPAANEQISTRGGPAAQSSSPGRQNAMRMSDPLVGFDWSKLYDRYDALCSRFAPRSEHLAAVAPVPATDRLLYYRLVRAAEVRPAFDVSWYESLLYWKLYSQPAAVSNIAAWLGADEVRRRRNAQQLRLLLKEMPPTIPQQLPAVISLLKSIDQYALDGMRTGAALPVRSTFLHIFYPTVVPIFDKMVLQAVGVTHAGANQNMDVFCEYLPHAWALANQHAGRLTGFSETPIRLTDMALWIIRN